MLVFIDESGDTGLKIDKGSSRYFVLALVAFALPEDAKFTTETIAELKASLNKKYEFKFSKSRRELKPAFFQTVKKCKFQIEAIVVDKKQDIFQTPNLDTSNIYNYYLRVLLQNASITDAYIILDGEKGEKFAKRQKAYLRQHLGDKMSDIKLRDSQKHLLIQLADMIAGAIACYYTDKNTEYYETFKGKITKIWEL